ncbi:dephospho-CoA kinase [Cellvibrio fibrivorans]|jgi:dephospho-CoA kinase|uniref:Dephospho-CoA kinase n=1 Tax=Cellvibrio fibrivorans TaxID=126350 RepID=A0ABU1V308_9GAMM|nr:dephospho-CoA kinase [Cellvibrio fibrivorans]MDR7091708.1 dephospho-CoA kinase [Cellvibrio fibrivorans]
MPLIIGLTGGIGSGKSEASKRFIERGILVVDADVVAREVVEPGSPALTQIAAHFGPVILDATGNLQRSKLREIIFSNPSEKQWLESLLHPIINTEIRRQLAGAMSVYAILASPLLLETQQFQLVDRILVIDTSEQHQLERASHRDKSNEAQIKAIMQTQLSRQERCARATDIIQNHGSIDELDAQVEKLHQLYLELAQSTAKTN